MNSLPEADLKDLKYKVNMGKPLTEEEFRAMRTQEGLPMPGLSDIFGVNDNDTKPSDSPETIHTQIKENASPVIDTSDIISPEAFQKMMGGNMLNNMNVPKPSRDQKRALLRENKKREKMKEKMNSQK